MCASARTLTLSILPHRFSILRFAPDAAVPAWASHGDFFSITRTADELSIVCAKINVPAVLQTGTDWRVLKVHGPFQFDEIGVLENLSTPLAATAIGIFIISTFDTDYLLVQSKDLRKACTTLQAAGHAITDSDSVFNNTKENDE